MPLTTAARPWVLGYSASHNGAVCLLRGSELVVAIQEERVRGEKRARLSRLDESLALRYCLDYAGITPDDLSAVVGCYFSGVSMQGATIVRQGWKGSTASIPHHLGHAWAAFVQSGFSDATILVVDGQGGMGAWLPESERIGLKHSSAPGQNERNEIISIYRADASGIHCVEKHLGHWIVDMSQLGSGRGLAQFGSLGGMFAAASGYIFNNAMEAGKVMGLAAFGQPRFPVSDFYAIDAQGQFQFSDTLVRQLKPSPRWPDNRELHQDLAASTQAALEHAMLHLVQRARNLGPSSNLCLVGGVALNNVTNEKIIALPDFDQVFIQPAAEDSGPAIGAAYYGLWQLEGRMPSAAVVQDSTGRPYDDGEIRAAIASTPWIQEVPATDVLQSTVDLLTAGKVVGWFQGGSELGPRALGQRSIIADPRRADTKDNLNLKVKHREAFRPFAPAILEDKVGDWFVLPAKDPTSPFMLRTFDFLPERRAEVPAVVHQDGSGRLQTLSAQRNGRFHELVRRFEAQTGVPILVNTSFNVMGEPIVESPEDALFGLLYTELDAVVLENRLLTRAPGYPGLLELYPGLTVQTIKIETELNGSFGPDARPQQQFLATVKRPSGKATHTIPAQIMPLLERIDGKRTCRQLLQGLQQQGLWSTGERQFRETLRHLRRIGVMAFKAKAWG